MQRMIAKVNHFSDTLKSEKTKHAYAGHIKQFLRTNPDPKTLDDEALTEHIEGYLLGMKQSGLHSASYNQAYSAINHYYSTKPNKKLLDWNEIKSVLGEKNHTGKKLGYKPEDIKKLLDVSDVTDKAKIGCLISGMRRGAMCDIKLEDMDYLSKDGIYMIKIYPNTDDEQIAFTTPEASKFIETYITKMKPELKGTYLFPARPIEGSDKRKTLKGEHINVQSVTIRMTHLAELAGLRTRKTDGTDSEKTAHRVDKPAVHALRHFARNAYKKARIPEENRLLLMGHSIGKVQWHYDETLSDEELFNDLKQDFLSAVRFLTIDQSKGLQTEITELKKAKSEIESLKAKINSMQQTQDQFTELSKKLYEAGILKKD